MEVKKLWTDLDFEEMGWHDSRLYQIKFPNEKCALVLYLDYIFRWEKIEESYKYWVSPCEITFKNVINLKLNLTFDDSVGVDINSINREFKGLTPNQKHKQWIYRIQTDKGEISFMTTGFEMNLINNPVLSDSQDLGSELFSRK